MTAKTAIKNFIWITDEGEKELNLKCIRAYFHAHRNCYNYCSRVDTSEFSHLGRVLHDLYLEGKRGDLESQRIFDMYALVAKEEVERLHEQFSSGDDSGIPHLKNLTDLFDTSIQKPSSEIILRFIKMRSLDKYPHGCGSTVWAEWFRCLDNITTPNNVLPIEWLVDCMKQLEAGELSVHGVVKVASYMRNYHPKTFCTLIEDIYNLYRKDGAGCFKMLFWSPLDFDYVGHIRSMKTEVPKHIIDEIEDMKLRKERREVSR